MISNKTQAGGTDLLVPATTIWTDIRNQVQEQIHRTTIFKGSVMESEIPPPLCLPHNQTCPAATSSEQPWAILDLGQHRTLWDSICPSLCVGFLLFYSPFQNHLISHTPHGPASLGFCDNIVLAEWKLKCFIPWHKCPATLSIYVDFYRCCESPVTNTQRATL